MDVNDSIAVSGHEPWGQLFHISSKSNEFIRDNQVQVLKPESGNAPMCFYVGIDKDVS